MATRAAKPRTRAPVATAAFASARCSRSRGAPGPRGWRRATTRGPSSTGGGSCSRGARTRRRTSRTCWPALDPAKLERIWFPLGEQTKEQMRAEAATRGSRGCTPAREPGGLLPRRRRLPRRSSSAAAWSRVAGRSSTSRAPTLGTHPGYWRFTPGQRRGLGVGGGEPLYALRTRAATNAVVVGPHAALARTPSTRRGVCTFRSGAPRSRFATARRRSRRTSSRPRGASGCSSTSLRTASPAARPRCSTRTTSSSAAGSSRRLNGPT